MTWPTPELRDAIKKRNVTLQTITDSRTEHLEHMEAARSPPQK